MNVWGTTVTDTVLVATNFCGFYAHVMMLRPLTFRVNAIAVAHPLVYVID